MDYKDLTKEISRYSLYNLVAFCCSKSSVFMRALENKPDVDTHWPWVLDAFACFSIRYGKENFLYDYDEDRFQEMYETIMDHIPAFFKKVSFLNAIEQFYVSDYGLQKRFYNHKFKLYRHCFLFSNKPLNEYYIDKYKFHYYRYISFAFVMFRLFELFKNTNSLQEKAGFASVYEHFYNKNLDLMKVADLSIERDKYTEYYRTVDDDNIKYCFNILWWKPFVTVSNNVYTPCPYHVFDSVTTSFVSNLTDGHDNIRQKFGEALEKFVCELILNSNQFEESKGEFIYGNSQKTSDAMAKSGNDYVFWEVKAFTPGYKVFLGNEKQVENAIDRVAEAVEQLFTSAFEKFQVEYWFNQDRHEDNVPIDNRWGMVVVNEEILVKRELIYKKAAEIHKVSIESNDYEIMRERIAISDIDEFEKCCIFGESIIAKLKNRKNNNDFDSVFQYNKDKVLIEYSNNKNNEIYSKIMQSLELEYQALIIELIEKGLVTVNVSKNSQKNM